MNFPDSIKNLINEFAKLPTVGPKTAERFVFYLLRKNQDDLRLFSDRILALKNNIQICPSCLNYSEKNPCAICTDEKRDKKILCIISDSRDLSVIESSHQYNGQYFILGGLLDTIHGVSPENLNIIQLEKKLSDNKFEEIIIALNPTIEGETTALYLKKILQKYNLKITKLARGLPTGADLEYADENTLSNALKYRNEL